MDLLTLPQVADYTNIPVATLRYWRTTGEGPKTFKLGGKVMARREDIDAWLIAAYETTATGGAREAAG